MTSNNVSPDFPEKTYTRRFQDPAVMAWAEKQGPKLNLTCRSVFKTLAEFVDPATGECFPSQETLAEILDTSRVTVNRAIQQILRVKGGGLMSSRKEVPRDGGWRYNVYRYDGVDTGWRVTVDKGQESAIDSMADRLEELQNWFVHLLEQCAERGIEHGVPDELVAEVYADTKEREDPDEYVSDCYIQTDPSPAGDEPSLSEGPVDVPERDTPPAADPVVEFVDANLDRIVVGRDQGGFDHRGGAITIFRASPAEFERWKRKLEADNAPAPTHLDEYVRRYGRYPWQKDAPEGSEEDVTP